MEYRKLSVNEAEQFWSLMNQLDYETKYMLYEPGERTNNLSGIESLIRDSLEGQDFLLVAETDNKLIGYISAQKGRSFSMIGGYSLFCCGNYRSKRNRLPIGREISTSGNARLECPIISGRKNLKTPHKDSHIYHHTFICSTPLSYPDIDRWGKEKQKSKRKNQRKVKDKEKS